MNEHFYFVFEFIVNVFQSIAVTHYLIRCFGVKSEAKRPYAEYLTGIALTLIYLEILNKITAFENIGVFVYLIISILYTMYLLKGELIEKIFYNVVMIVVIVFSTMAGAGLTSAVTGVSYSDLMLANTAERYIALIAVQIILCLLLVAIAKLKGVMVNADERYLKTMALIPVLSVVICCVLFFGKELLPYEAGNLVSFVGIVIINIASLYLLIMEHKLYEKHLQEENIINAYEQKEKDVDAIKAMKLDMDKLQHDNRKVYVLLEELLENKEYEKAKAFLAQYIDEKKIKSKSILYCNNIILNYLLNRKQAQCEELGLSFKCFVTGTIEGVKDVDLYILLENLLDNAMEAAIQTDSKRVDLDIYASPYHINMDIGNSVVQYADINIENMMTSKQDANKHGFGLKNVNDVVKKYEGNIKYDTRIEHYIVCSIVLNKREF